MEKVIHVAAGAVFNDRGQVLIARRPDNTHLGGLWEFPGGKLQPGETAEQALARELQEELGIRPRRSRPLIRVRHDYPDKRVLLDVWRVDAFDGAPEGREGQPIRWESPDSMQVSRFPAADIPVILALRLPARYLITPDCDGNPRQFLSTLASRLEEGVRLVQMRVPSVHGSMLEELVLSARRLCTRFDASLLLNGDPQQATAWGVDGVHLTGERLLTHQARPLAAGKLVAASCHDRAELEHACRINVDFAVLGPVQDTASHPGARPMGWQRFGALVESATVPVYALGGMSEEDLPPAWRHGAQGIAAIRSLWGA